MALRKRRTQKERSAATQARLLDAAIACIVELGYARTSTTEICRRAGVSRGAQVHHYPAKSALLAAAIEQLLMRRLHEFGQSLSSQPDLAGAFAELWQLYSGPTLHAWMELLIAARTDDGLREQLRVVDERFFAEAKRTARRLVGVEGVDDNAVAGITRLILSAFDGLMLNRTLGHPECIYSAALVSFEQMVAGLRGAE